MIDCTIDTCNPDGICQYTPDDSLCDNGLYCDGVETCDASSGCLSGTNPCPPPLMCDEDNDRCSNCLTDSDCDEGIGCTVDVCDQDGNCQNTPDDGLCDDSIDCTIDTCDQSNDCQHTPDDSLCDNVLFCDGVETCDASSGCLSGSDRCPPPLMCDDKNDRCTNCFTDADCDDDVGCTIDVCDENGNCYNTPDDDLCDDGLFCTGKEYCDDENDCVSPGNPCPWLCDEERDTCHTPESTTTTTTSTPVTPICDVVIAPSSEIVKSGDTISFIAVTTCSDVEVEGDYEWVVISTNGSSIDEMTGLYTAGENNTDSDVTDTIQVTDIDNGNITANASVTIEKDIPPPVCETTIEPSTATIDSGGSLTFTGAIAEGEGCLEPDYTWQIDTDIYSQITPSASSCFYQAGNNETGILLADTITLIDNANGTETEATVTVLYGKIVSVFPKVLLSSRWIPLSHVVIIVGEDTGFNTTSRPTFTPDDSITTIGQIGLGNIMGVLVLISRNAEEGTLNLAVTTTNGEGQEVTFTKDGPFKINLLPFILDESKHKP